MLTRGFDGSPDYVAVELVLTFCIGRRDVKELAKALVARFGSYKGVLEASEADLVEVQGMAHRTARNLRLIRLAADHYLQQRAYGGEPLTDPRALHDYVRARIGSLPTEEVWVYHLDPAHRLVAEELVARGTIDRAFTFPRQVVSSAISHNASAIIVAHNHPSGSLEPSDYDRNLTRALTVALSSVDLKLLDHLIVTSDSVYSFRTNSLL